MSAEMDIAVPNTEWPALKPYWDAARNHEFKLPRCESCKHFNWYPHDTCAKCGSDKFAWVKLSGHGMLYSWAVVHRALDRHLAALQPYVSGIVVIDEDPSVRVVTRILDVDPAMLRIGMPMEVRFEDFGYPATQTGITGPFWIPRRSA
jgi:uncharacterized OB-fold protein